VSVASSRTANPVSDVTFAAWSRERQQRIESVLERVLPAGAGPAARLAAAMRYATLGGGKRVRPLLAFAAAQVSRASDARVALAAAAVELIHAYSLVHDDLPCMDDDVLRRGKPTVHVEYDEATALLVGDALQSLAFQILSQPDFIENAKVQVEMVHLLAAAAGSRGMAGGQQIDLEATGRTREQRPELSELEFMHIHKTGALIRAAVLLGAACGEPLAASERAALDRYARAVGLAFQVVDDVLDAEASTATLGKTAGKDEKQGKPTYVTALGRAAARELAEELRAEAHAALAPLGSRAGRLGSLADFIVLRKF